MSKTVNNFAFVIIPAAMHDPMDRFFGVSFYKRLKTIKV